MPENRTVVTRRRLLRAGPVAMTVGIAGCTGGGGDSEGSDPDDDESGDGSTDTPTALDTPNGDASITTSFTVTDRDNNEIDQFDSLVVDFGKFVLRPPDGGEEVTIPAGEQLDLASFEPGESREVIGKQDIPTGEYKWGDFYMPVVEATKSDGSEPEIPFEGTDPIEHDLAIMDPLQVEEGQDLQFTLRLTVRKTFDDSSWEIATGHSIFY